MTGFILYSCRTDFGLTFMQIDSAFIFYLDFQFICGIFLGNSSTIGFSAETFL
jgi:hypothetical protein